MSDDPNETAAEVAAALRRNHPELSDADIEALLSGEPKRRRRGYNVRFHWTAGTRGANGGGSVVRGLSRGMGAGSSRRARGGRRGG